MNMTYRLIKCFFLGFYLIQFSCPKKSLDQDNCIILLQVCFKHPI